MKNILSCTCHELLWFSPSRAPPIPTGMSHSSSVKKRRYRDAPPSEFERKLVKKTMEKDHHRKKYFQETDPNQEVMEMERKLIWFSSTFFTSYSLIKSKEIHLSMAPSMHNLRRGGRGMTPSKETPSIIVSGKGEKFISSWW